MGWAAMIVSPDARHLAGCEMTFDHRLNMSESDAKLPDIGYVRELANVFKQYELDEIEIETGDTRVLLRRGELPVHAAMPAPAASAPAVTPPPAAAVAPVAASQPAAAVVEDPDMLYITSPFVGTFYRSPNPESPSFVEVGAKVQPGQTVCIVEAMKLFNELEAEYACIIESALVENGQPVEYGAKLFRVRKL